MDLIEGLIERNAAFVTGGFDASLRIMPTKKVIILGCADPRVDPAAIFGLAPGEAAVIRNVGGRVGPATLETMALLRAVVQDRGGDTGAGWNFVVLHHTDCGIINCHHHAPGLLARHLGVAPADLATLAIDDPYAAVALDVAALKAKSQPAGRAHRDGSGVRRRHGVRSNRRSPGALADGGIGLTGGAGWVLFGVQRGAKQSQRYLPTRAPERALR